MRVHQINDYAQLKQCIDIEKTLMQQATKYCKLQNWPAPKTPTECRQIGTIIKNVLNGNYDYTTW